MSDRLKTPNTVTNEEVIEDLTKDLELSLNTDELGSEHAIKPESTLEDFLPSAGDSQTKSGEF